MNINLAISRLCDALVGPEPTAKRCEVAAALEAFAASLLPSKPVQLSLLAGLELRRLPVSIDRIVDEVAAEWGITPFEVRRNTGRQHDRMKPRFAAIWLILNLCPNRKTVEIGAAMGGRDHTTIIYARDEAIPALIADDVEFRARLQRLYFRLKAEQEQPTEEPKNAAPASSDPATLFALVA